MAKPVKMKDRKDYMKRIHSAQTGNATGAEMSEESKFLAIKYDIEHNIIVSDSKRKLYEDYLKNKLIL